MEPSKTIGINGESGRKKKKAAAKSRREEEDDDDEARNDNDDGGDENELQVLQLRVGDVIVATHAHGKGAKQNVMCNDSAHLDNVTKP